MMAEILFHTQHAIDDLTRAGVPPEQARAQVKVLRDALEGGMATKAALEKESTLTRSELRQEIKEAETILRQEIKEVETTLRHEIKEVETRLDAKIDRLRIETRSDMAVLRSDMKSCRLQVLLALAGTNGILALGGGLLALWVKYG